MSKEQEKASSDVVGVASGAAKDENLLDIFAKDLDEDDEKEDGNF